jgi:type VII secretion integral membrane protein EccD
MSTGLARVTISAPQRRVDVALPENLPLAELLPEVLRHAGVGLADDGERHGGWVLRRTDGAALATAQALQPQGVRDGEVLHLVPARAQWPALEYDDVVEAIAEGARRRGSAWTGAATRASTLVGAAGLVAVALVAVLRGGPGWAAGPYAALGTALVLLVAAGLASRAYGQATMGAALGGYAAPAAFVGGALLVTSGDRVAPLPLVSWLGAPEVLAGSVALLLAAVLGLVAVGAGVRVFAAGSTVGLLASLTAAAGFLLSGAGAAAVLLSALTSGIGLVPLLAIRFGKLPMPPVTLPTGAEAEADFTSAGAAGSAARDLPDPARVTAAVARTEEVLTGLLTGHAVLAVGAAVPLVTVGGIAGRALVAVCAAVLLLRSRLFVTVRQRVPMLVAGMAGLALLGVSLAGRADPVGLFALVGAGAVGGLLVAVAGATWSRRPPSPYLARLADVVDTLMMVSVVPVACAVLGLYARAFGLLGG